MQEGLKDFPKGFNVKTVTGKCYNNIQIVPTMTISDLKNKMSQDFNIPLDQIVKFTFCAKSYKDDVTLGDIHLVHKNNLSLIGFVFIHLKNPENVNGITSNSDVSKLGGQRYTQFDATTTTNISTNKSEASQNNNSSSYNM